DRGIDTGSQDRQMARTSSKTSRVGGASRKAHGARDRSASVRPSREDAEAAVRTLLAWVGEDPARPGLRKTPARFLGAYDDWFVGYRTDPRELLGSSFQEVKGYDQVVALTNIDFESHCEHHVA